MYNHHQTGPEKISTVMNVEGNTLYIYDYIGQERWYEEDTTVTANDFVSQLRNISGDITVRINSKGGEVGNALAIYQQLSEHPGKVTCVVDGYAYSCASWILLAGEERYINVGGLVMVHNPSMYAVVDSDDAVEKIMPQWRAHRDAIVNIITNRTGLSNDKVSDMMKETTFMTSSEAIENNFCTALRETKANLPESLYNSLPDTLKPKVTKPEKVTNYDYAELKTKSLIAMSRKFSK